MGGQQSRTRKLTMENKEQHVIQISNEVADRLNVVRPVLSGASRSPVEGPVFCEPSLTSLQIRQGAEDQMKKNDEYWEKRVVELERSHSDIKAILDCEFNKAMEAARGPKKDESNMLKEPPCLVNKEAVVDCYRKYSKEPMRCAKEVQAFADCVDLKRAYLTDVEA